MLPKGRTIDDQAGFPRGKVSMSPLSPDRSSAGGIFGKREEYRQSGLCLAPLPEDSEDKQDPIRDYRDSGREHRGSPTAYSSDVPIQEETSSSQIQSQTLRSTHGFWD
jgi:hypothetical protein